MQLPKDLENYIDGWLSYLPPYGSFTYPKRTQQPPVNAEDVKKAAADIVREVFTEHGMEYLITNGFAIPRHDITAGDTMHYELTEKGRMLKSKGSIYAYSSYEEECLRKEERQINRDENVYWIQFCIAVGTSFAAAYYLLEIFLEISKRRFHMGDMNLLFCCYVFLAGILTGIAILLIAKEVLRRRIDNS